MIQLQHVTQKYKIEKELYFEVLHDINLTLPDHGMIFFLGANGSGKTTLLHLLGGLSKPFSGEIIINGAPMSEFTDEQLQMHRSQTVSYIFQDNNFVPEFSVGENISIALQMQGKEPTPTEVENYISQYNENISYSRNVRTISGGQQQKIAIFRAIAKNCPIILADEPTAALDEASTKNIFLQLKELSLKKLVVVVSHDKRSVEQYADRIIQINDGKVAFDSAPFTQDVGTPFPEQTDPPPSQNKKCLSVKHCVTLAFASIKKRVFKSIFNALLTAFSVFCSVLLLATALYDPVYSELLTLKSNGLQTAVLRRINGPIDELSTKYTLLPVYQANSHDYEFTIDRYSYNPYLYLGYYENFKYFLAVDPESGERDAHITPDARLSKDALCRLPQNETEVAITDLQADIMLRCSPSNAQTLDDLIGLKIYNRTIVGIYSTEIPLDELYAFDYEDENWRYGDDAYAIDKYFNSVITFSLVCDLSTEQEPIYYLYNFHGNIREGRDLTRKTNANLHSVYSSRMLHVDGIAKDYVMIGGSILCGIFILFSFLLFMNFITVGLETQKRQTAILLTLGARTRDIYRIYYTESILQGIFTAGISIIVSVIGCIVINYNLGSISLPITFVQFLLPIALCGTVAMLAPILPIKKFTRRTPAQLLTLLP